MRATLNPQLQIELLEFSVQDHQEFVPRALLQPQSTVNSPDVRASPHMKQGKRLINQQPQIIVPESHINHYGVAPVVIRFLEVSVQQWK